MCVILRLYVGTGKQKDNKLWYKTVNIIFTDAYAFFNPLPNIEKAVQIPNVLVLILRLPPFVNQCLYPH